MHSRKTAIEDHDRFIVQPSLQQSVTHHLSNLTKLSESAENDFRNDFALYEGRLIGSLEVSTVGKGRIELNFSDEFLLVITLEEISAPPVAVPPISLPTLPSLASTNVRTNNDTSNHDKDNKISNGIDNKWLSQLLLNGILQAQLLLLNHWKKSLEERERESLINTTAASINKNTNSMTSINSSAVMIKSEKIEPKVMFAIKTEDLMKTENKSTNNLQNLPSARKPLASSEASSLMAVSPKEQCVESHSVSLSGINFFHRLLNPVLRGRARDLGDGIAFPLASTGEWKQPMHFGEVIVCESLT